MNLAGFTNLSKNNKKYLQNDMRRGILQTMKAGAAHMQGGDACIRPYNNNHLQQQESYL